MNTQAVLDPSRVGARAGSRRLGRTLPALCLVVALVFSVGCGTTYCYRGSLTTLDTAGTSEQFVLYWNKTERPLWFDEAEGTVRLKPEHGTAIGFNEDEDGLIFRNDGTFEGAPDRNVAVGGACGRILTADRVVDLPEGEILVVLWCQGVNDDGFGAVVVGLVPRDQPYVFVVRRTEVAAGTDCSLNDGVDATASNSPDE